MCLAVTARGGPRPLPPRQPPTLLRFAPLVLAVLALPTAAQRALSPGSPDLVPAPLQSYEYEVRYAGDALRATGRLSYSETLDGDRLTLITRRSYLRGEPGSGDTTVVSWPSLAPVSRAFYGRDSNGSLTFADGRMRGRHVLGNLDEPVDTAVEDGAFGQGVATRLVRSVPLVAGYTATVRTAGINGGVTVDTVRVLREEPFARADGTGGMAWIVERVPAAGATTTYTVDAGTRALLRSAYVQQEGVTVETAPPRPPPAGRRIRPGDPALDTGWLTDDAATFTVRVLGGPASRDVGTATVARSVADGIVTLRTTFSVTWEPTVETTARAVAATLAPISHVSTGGPVASVLDFSPGRVVGTRTPAGRAAVSVSDSLGAPVFDAVWEAEVARSLPFVEGYTAAVETYDAVDGVQTTTYRVTSHEDVDGVLAWTVEAASPDWPTT